MPIIKSIFIILVQSFIWFVSVLISWLIIACLFFFRLILAMNTRFSDHEFSLNTLITIFFAYFDISTELATGSFFRMHGDRNNFYLIAFIFSEYQQKVRKIKYNQPDFFYQRLWSVSLQYPFAPEQSHIPWTKTV